VSDIFISYKSERRRAAWHLAKVLECYGYDVWYDYGLIPGDDFEPRLMAELGAAKVVLVLWCTFSVKSAWVQREARFSRQSGKYLPCWIEHSRLPDEFAGADTINLTEWRGEPQSHLLHRMLADIARRLDRDPIMSFTKLRKLEDDWRGYGAPSLAQFALGEPLTPDTTTPATVSTIAPSALGPLPGNLYANLVQLWQNAQQGDATALGLVGQAYALGVGGLPKDDKEAARLFRLAAIQGDADSLNNLAVMYDGGLGGLPQDEKEATAFYKLAADRGQAVAQTTLGARYVEGIRGLPKNEKEAARLFGLAADQGYALGQSSLGVMYARGLGGLPKNPTEAARLFKLAAEQGDTQGQRNLAEMYLDGPGGLPKNEMEAVRLFRLAADQGQAQAQCALGIMYITGRGGLAKDEKEAMRLFELAADQKDANAQFNLGLMHLNGAGGLQKDENQAVHYWTLAADQGHASARHNLEELARRNKSDIAIREIKQDAEESADPALSYIVGLAHLNGEGSFPKDEREAARFFRLAADRGHTEAQLRLALMYGEGRGGLPKDRTEAVRYLKLAASAGNTIAQEALKRIGAAG